MIGGVCTEHGHDPVEDAARGRRLPHRHEPAWHLRPELPRQGRHHVARPAARTQHVIAARDRRRPRPAGAQPRRAPERHGALRRPAHADRRRRRSARGAAGHRGEDRDRRRDPPRPAGDRRVRRQHDLDSDGILGLARFPTSLVVVGAGVIGIEYASMFAALGTKVTVVEQRRPPARVLRRRDRRGPPVPPARPRRHLPLRRDGRRRREARSGTRSRTSRAASGSRRTPCSTRPAARAPPTRSTSRTPGSRRTTRGRIAVDEHYRTAVEAHLRRRAT